MRNGLCVLAWCAWRGDKLRLPLRDHAWLALQGVFLYGVSYICVYHAERHLPSGLVAVGYSASPLVAGFGRRVADAGLTAVLPSLFGTPGKPMTAGYAAKVVAQCCISREFATLATGRTSPITMWLRKLAAAVPARIRIVEIGKTAEGQTQILAIISSPENMKRLDRYREISRRLALARGLTEEQATIAETFRRFSTEVVLPRAERIHRELGQLGIGTLLDDRSERAGVKFNDADLIGAPYQVVIGDKGMAQGVVELKERKTGEVKRLPPGELPERAKTFLRQDTQAS
jgi:hypothetical protein